MHDPKNTLYLAYLASDEFSLLAHRKEGVSEHLSNCCRIIEALGCCFMERYLFLPQAVWLLWRKGGLCRAVALRREGQVGHLTSMPSSAAHWGLPFKHEVRNGELRALPKRHLLGRSELSDWLGPHVPHHVSHWCVLRIIPPGDSLLGKTTGIWTTCHPAPLCPDKAHGSSKWRWPWASLAVETNSALRLLPAEGALLGHHCVPQDLLPTAELPAEVENVLFQLTNFGFYTSLLKKT